MKGRHDLDHLLRQVDREHKRFATTQVKLCASFLRETGACGVANRSFRVDTSVRQIRGQNSAEFLADETRARQHRDPFIGPSPRKQGHPLATRCTTPTRPGTHFAVRGAHSEMAPVLLQRELQQHCSLLHTSAVVLLVPSVALAVDAPEGTVKSQHGDWQVVCKDPPPGAKNAVCALVQSVTAEDKNNIGLTVYFQKFSNGTRVLRVFAPLGVLLPPGLGLKIDDKDVGHAPFLRCHSFACYAQVVVDDPLIERLKTGKTAIFIIFQTEEAGIGIPISLKGFGEALGDLK